MSEIYKVDSVVHRDIGSAVDGDHAAGVTVLAVLDPSDFNEEGGTFAAGAATIAYTGWDEETGTIALAAPLSAGLEDGAKLVVLPAGKDGTAYLVDDESGEPLEATIPPDQIMYLPEGPRDADTAEVVEVDVDPDGEAVVLRTLRETPTLDLTYADPETLPPLLSDGQAPATAPSDFAVRQFSVGAVEASWTPPVNADQIVGYDVEASLAPPWAGTPDVFRTGSTKATVSSIGGTLLASGQVVQVRVRAVDVDGAGPWTAVASAQPRIVGYDLISQQIRDNIDAATAAAGQAVLAANGKNKNTRSTTTSPTVQGRVENDMHYTIGTGDKAGQVVKIERLMTGVWVDEPVNVAVFAGLDAAYVNTIILSANTVLAEILAAGEVSADLVDTDFLRARSAEIIDLIVQQLRTERSEVGDAMVLDGPTSTLTIWKDASRNEILFSVGPNGAVNRIPMDTLGISAMGAVILKSPDSRLDPGAAMTTSAGSVADPAQPPLLSSGTKPVASWPAVPSGFVMRGISWDNVDGCWLRLLVSTATDPSGKCRIERIDAAGNSLGYVTLGNVANQVEKDMNAVVRVGSSYYVNSLDPRSGYGWGVAKFAASTGAFQAISDQRSGISGRPTLCASGSGNEVFVYEVFSGKLRVVVYSAVDLQGITFGDALTTWSESNNLMGAIITESTSLFDFTVADSEQIAIITATKVLALSRDIYTGAYTRQAAHDITLDADVNQGGAGNRPGYGWHSTTAASRILGRYTTYRNPGGVKSWGTYADRNADGKTTKDSPAADMLIPNHRWVIFDLPNPVGAATEQWAYMGLGTTLPSDANLKHRTEPQVGRRLYVDPTTAGGASVPSANTFPGGSPAVHQSEAENGWKWWGDGRTSVRTPILPDEVVPKAFVDNLTIPKATYVFTGSSPYADGSLRFVRVGNLVVVDGGLQRASGFSSSMTAVGTLPVGYRPRASFTTASAQIFVGGTLYQYSITSAGVVSARQSAANANGLVWPGQPYVTDDPMPA